jgi:hypothetical protein
MADDLRRPEGAARLDRAAPAAVESGEVAVEQGHALIRVVCASPLDRAIAAV